MNWSHLRRIVGASLMIASFAGKHPLVAQSATPSPTPVPTPAAAQIEPVNEEVVVSATKMAQDPLEVAADVTVVSGDELRRRGAKTIAEALQDVAGLDTGSGSDNGSRLANIGVWGLKEFDALSSRWTAFRRAGLSTPRSRRSPSKTSTGSRSSRGRRARSTECRPSPA